MTIQIHMTFWPWAAEIPPTSSANERSVAFIFESRSREYKILAQIHVPGQDSMPTKGNLQELIRQLWAQPEFARARMAVAPSTDVYPLEKERCYLLYNPLTQIVSGNFIWGIQEKYITFHLRNDPFSLTGGS